MSTRVSLITTQPIDERQNQLASRAVGACIGQVSWQLPRTPFLDTFRVRNNRSSILDLASSGSSFRQIPLQTVAI